MATSPIYNWPEPDNTDLVKNGALAMRTLGDAIDTTMATMTPKSIVDAKGDLIAASAADTPARLAVGNNGETLVADSSTSTGLRWQAPKTNNVLINGNFDIWQRSTSIAGAQGGSFVADRWTNSISGTTVDTTISQNTSVPNVNSKYSIKIQQVTSGATSIAEYCLRQRIEQSNLIPLLGKATILSFWYRSNKTGSHGVRVYGSYNTGGTDQVATITVNAADTWEYKTVAVTAFSAVSAPSANATDAGALVDIGFRVGGTGAGFTSLSTNDYFQIAQVQLEVGSVATPFARAGGTIQGELAACQRYYTRVGGAAAYETLGTGAAIDTSQVLINVKYPVTMRTAPTAIEQSTLAVYDGTTIVGSPTSVTMVSAETGKDWGAIIFNKASTVTTFRPYKLFTQNSTSGYLAFTAEL